MPREFALPGARPRYARDRVCDVEHLLIDVDIDTDARRIEGICSITMSALSAGTRFIELDAVELDIDRVSEGGRELAFAHDGRLLRIDLDRSLAAADRVTVDVRYAASPRRGLYFVAPDEGYPDKPVQVWTQGQDEDSRFWFPCFDAPHEKATTEVIATVPERFFALSNGTLVSDTSEGGRRRMHWKQSVPHSAYLVTLVAGELAEVRDSWNGKDVSLYVEPGREAEARRAAGKTPEMLSLFSELFGVEYPYEKYAQVFVADFIFGGMENTTATTLTDIVLLDERAALDYDVEALIAHELAHQWFGDLLTCRDWGEAWLNEGFATYAEYLWREHAEGADAAALELEEWAEQYFGEDTARYRRTIATRVYDEPIEVFDHHLYEKGGRVLHMLRRHLGDERFFAAVRHYLTKHRTGTVETRDLARAVEEATGKVVDWFFDQWVERGSGHPVLTVTYAWDAESGAARVAITQKQRTRTEDAAPWWRLPATMRFRVGDEDRDVELDITDEQQVFFVPLDAEPSQVIFDPGKHLLARVELDKSPALWAAELAGATAALDRIHAARALGSRGGERALAALSTALQGDPFWAVRAEAALALGAIRTERARDALIEATGSEQHPKARRRLVRALGSFRHDAAVANFLAGLIERGDPSYFVEAEACLSLGKTRWPGAREVLEKAAGRESFTDVIRQHAYKGLAETRDEAVVPMLLEATRYGKVSHGRRAAVGALAELVRHRRDAAARDVRERLEELLRDRDFRIQSAAIEGLATIGDPSSIAALRGVVDRELDGRLRRRSREVIRDLESGQGKDEQIGALRDELDKLRAEALRLRERLDRLESGDSARPGKKPRPAKKSRAGKKARPDKKAKSGKKGGKQKSRPSIKARAR